MNFGSVKITAKRTVILFLVIVLIMAICVPAFASTRRIHRAAITLMPGGTRTSPALDVSSFNRIRIYVRNRSQSPGRIRVKILIMDGTDVVTELEPLFADRATSQTKVIETPGISLKLIAEAPQTAGVTYTVEVFVYGSD